MRNKYIPIAAGALTLSALAAIGVLSNPQPAVISPSQVMTWDCEIPTHKPEAITITCGDGGMYLDHIDWSRWEQQGAEGSGIYNVNNCDPDCADGTFLRVQVKVHLSNLTRYQGKHFLRTLVFETSNGENLPKSGQSFYEWDVMEFAEMMGED